MFLCPHKLFIFNYLLTKLIIDKKKIFTFLLHNLKKIQYETKNYQFNLQILNNLYTRILYKLCSYYNFLLFNKFIFNIK